MAVIASQAFSDASSARGRKSQGSRKFHEPAANFKFEKFSEPTTQPAEATTVEPTVLALVKASELQHPKRVVVQHRASDVASWPRAGIANSSFAA